MRPGFIQINGVSSKTCPAKPGGSSLIQLFVEPQIREFLLAPFLSVHPCLGHL